MRKKFVFTKGPCISKILRTRDAKKAFCGRSKIALTEITSRTTDCFIAALERCGAIAQLGERLNGIQEVSGLIPLISTKQTTKPRVSTHKEHFDISEGSNSLVQQRHAVTSFTGEIPGKNQPPQI